MTISDPRFAAGIWIPNSTLSIPSRDGDGLPEGWVRNTGSADNPSGYYSAEGPWHSRVQEWRISTTALREYWSPPTPYRHFSPGATYTQLQVLYGWISGSSASAQIQISLYYFDFSGNLVGSDNVLSLNGSESAGTWVLKQGTTTGSVPSTAAYAKAKVALLKPIAGTYTFRLAFIGFGCWQDTTAGYYDIRTPSFPGSYAMPVDSAAGHGVMIDPSGYTRNLVSARTHKTHDLSFSWAGIDSTDHTALRRMWHLNRGIDDDAAVSNPNGDPRPLLVLPGHAAAPGALYADVTSFGFAPSYFFQDPPLWSGSLGLRERVL